MTELARDDHLSAATKLPVASVRQRIQPAPQLAAMLRLQRLAGNRAVQRLYTSADVDGTQENIRAAVDEPVDSLAFDKISDIKDWTKAEPKDRSKAADRLLKKGVLMPWNYRAMKAIWDAYGDGIVNLDADQVKLLERCVERGSVKPRELNRYLPIVTDFEKAVHDKALTNLDQNLTWVRNEATRLGISGTKDAATPDQSTERIQELQMLAGEINEAKAFLRQLRRVKVGFKPNPGVPFVAGDDPIYFDPASKPYPPPNGFPANKIDKAAGVIPWEDVNGPYTQISLRIGDIMTKNASLSVLMATKGLYPQFDDERDPDKKSLQFDKNALAGFETLDAKRAREQLTKSFESLTESLTNTMNMIEDDEIEPMSLDSLGLRVASAAPYNLPFSKWACQHELKEVKSSKENASLALTTVGALLFVAAEIATLGGATAVMAVLAGAGLAATGGAAALSASEAMNLAEANRASIGENDKLVSDAKVASAELQAAIAIGATVLAAIGFAAGALFKPRPDLFQLANLSRLEETEAATLVRHAIKEVGAAETAARAGIHPNRLLKYVAAGSAEEKAIQELLETVAKQRRLAGASLADSEALERFGQAAFANRSKWAELSPKQRIENFEDAINDELANLGLPRIRVVPVEDMPPGNAAFNGGSWQIKVSLIDIGADAPEGADALMLFERQLADLSADIYHEAQHARDTFQAARYRAGEGWTYERLTASPKQGGGGISDEVAKLAKARPLDPKSAEGMANARLANNLIPEDAHEVARLNKVLDDMDKAKANRTAKRNAYMEAVSRRDSPQTLAGLKRMADDAETEYLAAYREYRGLDHELEGWNAGGLITAKYEDIAAKQGVKLAPGDPMNYPARRGGP